MKSTLLKLRRTATDLVCEVEGQDLMEYGLIVSLIALVSIATVSQAASAVNSLLTPISSSLA